MHAPYHALDIDFEHMIITRALYSTYPARSALHLHPAACSAMCTLQHAREYACECWWSLPTIILVRMGRKHVVSCKVWLIGIWPTLNQGFIALVASVVGLQAKSSQFLAAFNGLIAATAQPCAYISRSGHFRGVNNRRTNRFIALPLAHTRGVRNNACSSTINVQAWY
jgi:hypothetical protein